MFPSREEVLASAAKHASEMVAVEAFWEGDTSGWFVVLAAVLRGGESVTLCVLSGGGDIRVFNGQVPPWPEAQFAKLVGEEIATRFDVPFWFPSPEYPEDDCARFVERSRAYPCSVCGIPLLQREPCPWKGTCHHCHLAAQKR